MPCLKSTALLFTCSHSLSACSPDMHASLKGSKLNVPAHILAAMLPSAHCFMQHSVLSCRPQLAVTISSPTTGIKLEVDTTSPGLQFYSGGLLSADTPVTGKAGVDYPQFGGFAVETQVLKTCCTCNK